MLWRREGDCKPRADGFAAGALNCERQFASCSASAEAGDLAQERHPTTPIAGAAPVMSDCNDDDLIRVRNIDEVVSKRLEPRDANAALNELPEQRLRGNGLHDSNQIPLEPFAEPRPLLIKYATASSISACADARKVARITSYGIADMQTLPRRLHLGYCPLCIPHNAAQLRLPTGARSLLLIDRRGCREAGPRALHELRPATPTLRQRYLSGHGSCGKL